MDFKNSPFVPPAVIIASALIIVACIASWSVLAARSYDSVLSVTGSAKKRVTADSVKWSLMVVRKVGESDIADGYSLVYKDSETVRAFLTKNGIPDADILVQPPSADEIYRNDYGPRDFNVRQSVVVNSMEVDAVESLSKRVQELSAKGIFVQNNWLEYYVSTLPALRVELLGAAVTDAKARAVEIAKAGGTNVGALKSAASGVVQVLAPNSIDVSDYGQYDTQSKEKDVMITARATFFVR
ncbi:MAG: hypothetical protein RLZZ283_360 [Candidatus Parcubacteria bacterium]|jgi:hypothetical protein